MKIILTFILLVLVESICYYFNAGRLVYFFSGYFTGILVTVINKKSIK